MDSKIDLEKFNKLKEETKEKYNSIREIYCPALKSKIIFSSNGFHHLIYDQNRNERSKLSQKGKFICFDDAVKIINKSTTIQEYRRAICPVGKKNKGGLRRTEMIEWFGMFAVISFSRKIRVNVIIRRIGGKNGSYHFWSVIPYWKLSNQTRIVGSKEIEDK